MTAIRAVDGDAIASSPPTPPPSLNNYVACCFCVYYVLVMASNEQCTCTSMRKSVHSNFQTIVNIYVISCTLCEYIIFSSNRTSIYASVKYVYVVVFFWVHL